LRRAALRLSGRLLAPARDAVGRAERLLILPDGPLHLLPFAALAVPSSGGGAFRFLVEELPVTVSGSATLFAELASRPPAARAPRLVALGDPDYGEPAGALGGAVNSPFGLRLPPLPATRREVEALAEVFGSSAEIYLGEEATEERVRSAAPGASHLHLAAHGWLDEASPLDSAVVLSRPSSGGPGRDNGLLQAWEVFEGLRLDADLVVLSACETGLGRPVGGEGLLGLTRAFQYAGARSVLVSMWAVDDRWSAVLIERFYRHLRAGLGKDEALRRAQLALLRGASESGRQTFHWAAFQLVGSFGGG
jgi:CHAT domain-containing protein